MKAKIKEKKEIAKDTILIKFEVLDEDFTFRAGQYFFVTLTNPPYSDERGNQRHFSIVNSPNEKNILTMATRIGRSAFKRSLLKLKLGAEVYVGNIGGDFTLPEDVSRPIVFVAGGIGITPFISMIRLIEEDELPYNITFFFSNRSRGTTPFLDELAYRTASNKRLKLVLTMTEDSNWKGEKGIIDTKLIKKNISDTSAPIYFVAGPPGMVNSMQNLLFDIGVKNENIRAEDFSGY